MNMLDLYCCEGLGALGYQQTALFGKITGIDIEDMSNRYSHDFVQGDAIRCDYDLLAKYQFVHASPPCQGYSKATPVAYKGNHQRLIAATHLMLTASGLPYVIENVEGSGQELRPNLCLTGEDVGLPMKRRRYFYVHGLHTSEREFKRICGFKFKRIDAPMVVPNGAEYVTKNDLMRAYGMYEYTVAATHKFTRYGLEQGIPPRMTQAIASVLFGLW